MSASLLDLEPEFRVKYTQIIHTLEVYGLKYLTYFTLRDPVTQAKLWRQSRSLVQVEQQMAAFQKAGAEFLAQCIVAAGPQNGKWATNAPPGLSWHQWGQAADTFAIDDEGHVITDGEHERYRILADEAWKAGLDSGYYWKSHKDYDHIQAVAGSVLSHYSIQETDKIMQKKFENLLSTSPIKETTSQTNCLTLSTNCLNSPSNVTNLF